MCCTDGLSCPFGCHADHENDEDLDAQSTVVYSHPDQQEEPRQE